MPRLPRLTLVSCVMAACLALSLAFAGCSRQGEYESADTGAQPESTPAPSNSKGESPNADDAFAQTIALVKVHVKHKEYDKAESILETALANSDVGDKSEAITLLDKVKTLKERGGRKPVRHDVAAKAAADTPDTHKAEVNSGRKKQVRPVAKLPAVVADAKSKEPQTEDARGPAAGNVSQDQPNGENPKNKPAPVVGVNPEQPNEAELPPKEPENAAKLDVRNLERNAKKARTAKDALALYDLFLRAYKVTESQRKTIKPRHEVWTKRAGEGLVRLGIKWVTPQEAKKAEEDADRLITEAVELIVVGDDKHARKKFLRASMTDPNGIRADFILGLLNSITTTAFRHPPTAEKHFNKVLERVPNHIPALNNLALAEMRQQKFASAYNHWKLVIESNPGAREATHNIGRLIAEASNKKLKIRRDQLDDFGDLYSKVVAAKKGKATVSQVGWLYSPLVLPAIEREREQKSRPDAKQETLVAAGSGSGVVLEKGLILTNRHVVEHEKYGVADSVTVVDPSDPKHKRELKAEIVAIADDHDLAVLRCDALEAPSVEMIPIIPRRGTEILILGYPESSKIGRSLKTTKGIVTALPDPTGYNMLLFDAEANHGNSGGPVCDNSGAVLAILTIGVFPGERGKYTGGVPTGQALPFIRKHFPAVKQAEANAQELEWPDVDEKVSKSTVMVLTYYKGFALGLDQAATQPGGQKDYLVDNSCSSCNGLAHSPCPNRRCRRGVVKVPHEYYKIVKGPVRAVKIKKVRYVKEKCPTCRGRDHVPCPHCRNGIDPSLK